LAEDPVRKVVEAPPWAARLLTPVMARHIAQELARKHPGLGADEIAAKMRADLGPNPEPAALRMVEAVLARLPTGPGQVPAPKDKVTWRSP
jgi:hypothetical protein